MGRKLLRSSLISPLSDIPTIEMRLDTVEAFLGDPDLYTMVKEVLPLFTDLNSLIVTLTQEVGHRNRKRGGAGDCRHRFKSFVFVVNTRIIQGLVAPLFHPPSNPLTLLPFASPYLYVPLSTLSFTLYSLLSPVPLLPFSSSPPFPLSPSPLLLPTSVKVTVLTPVGAQRIVKAILQLKQTIDLLPKLAFALNRQQDNGQDGGYGGHGGYDGHDGGSGSGGGGGGGGGGGSGVGVGGGGGGGGGGGKNGVIPVVHRQLTQPQLADISTEIGRVLTDEVRLEGGYTFTMYLLCSYYVLVAVAVYG